MLIALTQGIIAQQEKDLAFTSLDWNEMKIDSVLPVYTEVVPLETDYRTHTYTVSLLYPEYAALSSKEAEVAARFDSLLSETIDVETFVGIERGKGLLDISFIPIRRQGSKYEKLISAQIVINANRSGRLNAPRQGAGSEGRYAANSKLARWASTLPRMCTYTATAVTCCPNSYVREHTLTTWPKCLSTITVRQTAGCSGAMASYIGTATHASATPMPATPITS